MRLENLCEIIASLTEEQQDEVQDFVMLLAERGSQRPKTRLRQDWAGGLISDNAKSSALEIQRDIFA